MTILLDAPAVTDPGRPRCEGCGFDGDLDELRPDLNGDLYCGDCRTTFAGLDDDAEYTAYAYH
jgi:hypothetical protein